MVVRRRYIKPNNLRVFLNDILALLNIKDSVKFHLVESLILSSLRGVDSHGVPLFPHYVRALRAGRINGNPKYRFYRKAPSIGKLNADHTFGHAAGAEGMIKAMDLAKETGVGAVAVYNSSHFGAAAYYSLIAANNDMIGISFTHADSLLLTYNGKKAYFGTNPLCFAAPCKDEEPFCLDMATSIVTWNKIKLYKERGKKIPRGVAANNKGRVTTIPSEIESLLPIGGYKGFGLSMMIDILCSLLTGMAFGRHIVSMYRDPIHKHRLLGHFFIAIDISCFEKIEVFKTRLKEMMDDVRAQPAVSSKKRIMVAGDPEKKCFAKRIVTGIPFEQKDIENFEKLANEFNLKFSTYLSNEYEHP